MGVHAAHQDAAAGVCDDEHSSGIIPPLPGLLLPKEFSRTAKDMGELFRLRRGQDCLVVGGKKDRDL
ncbi:hypothetical protein [Methanogenium cariaci]|uniref:hypothetical protein n=1 Tax=Methanogenium cariaci TaxID=2197 RepID=UPI0012F701A9|nr:hypothetical protein [Methanogenium cariaci]